MFPIYKVLGQFLDNRHQVRIFKTKDAMYKFLGEGDNSLHWKECRGVDIPNKAGIYFWRGLEPRWINVKELLV